MPQIDLNRLREQVGSSRQANVPVRRFVTSSANRRFLHKIGGGTICLAGGSVIYVILGLLIMGVLDKNSSLGQLIMFLMLAIPVFAFIRGWKGQYKSNSGFELAVGIIVASILTLFIITHLN